MQVRHSFRYRCTCGYKCHDWSDFLRHVFEKPEVSSQAHYIVDPKGILQYIQLDLPIDKEFKRR